ncbi:MAG: citramalate synthase [Desulfotalea sp.]
MKIEIYDTTLRDGTQAENFNISVEDKLRITQELDNLGVDFVEGGWPGSNPVSVEYFNRISELDLKHTKIAAFGSTRHIQKSPETDPNLKALLAAKTDAITIFGKTWDIHVTDALKISLEDNLQIIEDSLAFLKPQIQHLFYDAEHFFDGYKNNEAYALKTIEAAIRGGAESIILCDTNGGTLAHEIQVIVNKMTEFLKNINPEISLGIHAHNDSESAVANTLMAVSCGATQIQGTINGFGERCGNANLTSIIPALVFKMGYECNITENIEHLYGCSRLINELANLPHNRYQPYVGESAFAHKGGIHVSAVSRNPKTYEHIPPEKIGNIRRILLSDQAGKSNILNKAEKWGIKLDPKDPILPAITQELKELENQGYQYEGAEASFELVMRKILGLHRNFFTFQDFRVMDNKYRMDKAPLTEATIRLAVGGIDVHTAATGDGPVNALDTAIRKSLIQFYPVLEEIVLLDYKVRVLSGEQGTEAKVRVLIESRDNEETWGTVGVSLNIIEASWQALVDSINYKLMKENNK